MGVPRGTSGIVLTADAVKTGDLRMKNVRRKIVTDSIDSQIHTAQRFASRASRTIRVHTDDCYVPY
jgi:hypothetical protein